MIAIRLNTRIDCNNLCQKIDKEIQRYIRDNGNDKELLLSIQIKEIIDPENREDTEIKKLTFTES
jgi:DNA integrity scanning protein DisA with diadenylate cyclase activity